MEVGSARRGAGRIHERMPQSAVSHGISGASGAPPTGETDMPSGAGCPGEAEHMHPPPFEDPPRRGFPNGRARPVYTQAIDTQARATPTALIWVDPGSNFPLANLRTPGVV